VAIAFAREGANVAIVHFSGPIRDAVVDLLSFGFANFGLKENGHATRRRMPVSPDEARTPTTGSDRRRIDRSFGDHRQLLIGRLLFLECLFK
jgi:hypothetical protein